MSLQIGDKAIHLTHGLGEIVRIEERIVRDHPTNCYVFCTPSLMTWIPMDDLQWHNLRMPIPPEEFSKFFDILTAPSEKLLDDRELRKDQLLAQLKDGQLASIFRVVRDLTNYKRSNKLNDWEKSTLELATNSILTEWTFSMGMTLDQAQLAMTSLLGE